MRALLAVQGWGLLQDSHGNVRKNVPFTITDLSDAAAPVYVADTGSTQVAVLATSTTDGTFPGYMEVGTYKLTRAGVTIPVEVVSGRSVGEGTPTDGSVTLPKLNAAVKPSPSGSAAAGDMAVRALGTGATQAAAGDDARFPSSGQKNALAGTNGTPGTGNEYVTKSDAARVLPSVASGKGVVWNGSAWVAASLITDPGSADGDLLVRSGSGYAALAKPGSPTGERLIVRTDGTIAWGAPPEFHAAAWGAIGDGTTDDRQAVRDAYVACENAGGGYVVLGGRSGKTHKFGPTATNPVPISRNGTSGVVGSRGWVIVKGNGATIKLTSQVYRAFDCQYVADYDCYARVGFEDVTVDRDNVARTDNNHVFAGNLSGNWTARANFRWWYFKNCRTINVPAANTDGDGTATTGSQQSVSLGSRHNGAGETQTFVRDIYDINCDFGGGGGVFAGGTGAGTTGVNVYCDKLVSLHLTHDTGITPSAPPTATPSHFHVQHGGTGFGGSSTIIGLRGYGSNDLGIEQDTMLRAYCEDCVIQDAWNVAYLPINFQTPRDFASTADRTSIQTYTYKNCWNVVRNIDPPNTTTDTGNAYGWCLSGTAAAVNHVVLEDCGNLNLAPSLRVNGEALCVADRPIRKLTLRNFKAIHETVNYSPGSAPTWSFIRYAPSVANEFDARGVHYSLGGTYGGPSATGRFIIFGGAGPTTISYDDPVYESTISWAAGAIYAEWYGRSTGSADCVITSGAVRRRKARNFTTAATVNIRGFEDTTALTITNELVDQDCDHTGFPSATASDVLFGGGGAARAKVKSRGGTPRANTTIASAATITLPDKGDFFSISGTTNITSITASWTGRIVTLKFLGILTFTDGSNLVLAGNANLVTAASTTWHGVYDGTNWIEMGRAVN